MGASPKTAYLPIIRVILIARVIPLAAKVITLRPPLLVELDFLKGAFKTRKGISFWNFLSVELFNKVILTKDYRRVGLLVNIITANLINPKLHAPLIRDVMKFTIKSSVNAQLHILQQLEAINKVEGLESQVMFEELVMPMSQWYLYRSSPQVLPLLAHILQILLGRPGANAHHEQHKEFLDMVQCNLEWDLNSDAHTVMVIQD